MEVDVRIMVNVYDPLQTLFIPIKKKSFACPLLISPMTILHILYQVNSDIISNIQLKAKKNQKFT